MRKRFPSFSLSSYGAGWSANRRIAIVASILAVLLAIAGIIALLTGGRDGHPAPDAGQQGDDPGDGEQNGEDGGN
ncbi:hypothetical protein PV338_14140, partial [Streptomyces scabiei]|nr:hypothetical protein [Streptomyces scabiei]